MFTSGYLPRVKYNMQASAEKGKRKLSSALVPVKELILKPFAHVSPKIFFF